MLAVDPIFIKQRFGWSGPWNFTDSQFYNPGPIPNGVQHGVSQTALNVMILNHDDTSARIFGRIQ